MKNDPEIVFNANSGISEEEQRDILAQINGIAEKNRLSLSGGENTQSRFTAQKNNGVFPILVNIAAVVILVGGIITLSSFQGKTDAQVRAGTMVYDSAERALIEEIRKETASRLEAKEREISEIASRLASIDAELRQNPDNSEANEELKATQEQYRATLAQLQNERSLILEEARTKEAILQAQLENRTRELAIVAQQSIAAIDIARQEMDKLTGDREQTSVVEAQMGAFFANLNEQLGEGRLEEAAATVQSMRSFLNTPAFQSLRFVQARKDMYTQSIDSIETMIEAARGTPLVAAPAEPLATAADNDETTLADLQKQNAMLEQSLAEKDKTIAALSSKDDGARRIAELEGSVTALRTMNTGLEASSNEKTSRIQTLEADNATLNQTINARNSTITRIQDVLQGKVIADMSFNEINDSLARIQAALGNQ